MSYFFPPYEPKDAEGPGMQESTGQPQKDQRGHFSYVSKISECLGLKKIILFCYFIQYIGPQKVVDSITQMVQTPLVQSIKKSNYSAIIIKMLKRLKPDKQDRADQKVHYVFLHEQHIAQISCCITTKPSQIYPYKSICYELLLYRFVKTKEI